MKTTVILLTFILSSCAMNTKMEIPDFAAGPDAIVYKTSANYKHLVPVSLSADGKTLLSFPHPEDIKTNGVLAMPTPLKKGYLLDNRGIGPRVAFTSFTYEEYARLEKTPSIHELLQAIIDPNPLEEMYNCGRRSNYESIHELNQLIKNKFTGANQIK